MAKCVRCGKRGLFLKLNSRDLCSDCVAANARKKEIQFQMERSGQVSEVTSSSTISELIQNNEIDVNPSDVWFAGERDKTFISLQAQYYRAIEVIECDYSILTNMTTYDSSRWEKLEIKCLDAMAMFEMLIPMWKKYDRGIPYSSPAHKRLAMIREKQGNYEGAALACVQQLRLGVFADGTKGGMRGRLARMVKKGNLIENKEAMREISKYLEI